MADLDDATLAGLLRERREVILRAAEERAASFAEIAGARSAATADDEHDPEGATLSEEWSRLAGLEERAARDLAEVDDALRRLADGSSGLCEACGRRIPAERLAVRPTATRCVGCACRR
ncbi:TraR/DksA family transcriptional regulator [Microbacterium sp. gxy059]|uniref:TraR/DksA family transcriptional regulator n=1 Tax=Microbacterium sp. gxy059 TaxID=2957199 RepID=UPI003D994FB9